MPLHQWAFHYTDKLFTIQYLFNLLHYPRFIQVPAICARIALQTVLHEFSSANQDQHVILIQTRLTMDHMRVHHAFSLPSTEWHWKTVQDKNHNSTLHYIWQHWTLPPPVPRASSSLKCLCLVARWWHSRLTTMNTGAHLTMSSRP